MRTQVKSPSHKRIKKDSHSVIQEVFEGKIPIEKLERLCICDIRFCRVFTENGLGIVNQWRCLSIVICLVADQQITFIMFLAMTKGLGIHKEWHWNCNIGRKPFSPTTVLVFQRSRMSQGLGANFRYDHGYHEILLQNLEGQHLQPKSIHMSCGYPPKIYNVISTSRPF